MLPGKPYRFSDRHIFPIIVAALIGLLVSGAILLLSFSVREFFELIETNILSDIHISLIILILIISGIIGSFIVVKLSPTSEGPGLHVAVKEFHKKEEKTPSKNIFFKFLATFVNVGSGSSMGLVSPSSLIGFVIGEKTGESLHIDRDMVRTLSLCGLAAAISTLLETPFGAAVFAVEVVYTNKILYKRFFLSLVSSSTAYLMSRALFVNKPILSIGSGIPGYNVTSLSLIVLIALIVTLLNILFIKFYQEIHDRVKKEKLGIFHTFKPALGMFSAGLLLFPLYILFIDLGYAGGYTKELIPLDIGIWELFLVSMTLFLSTAIIAGTGNSGGLFMPIMVFGGLIGRVISMNILESRPAIFITAGMSAAISTTLNVPIASAIICMELFGPQAILPATIGSLSGYFLGDKFVIYHSINWK